MDCGVRLCLYAVTQTFKGYSLSMQLSQWAVLSGILCPKVECVL